MIVILFMEKSRDKDLLEARCRFVDFLIKYDIVMYKGPILKK